MQRVALVTAGGSGMGAACAERLAADGYAVGILSSSGRGEALALRRGGLGMTGSNRAVADIGRFVAAAMDRWGRIDVLVNSAGHGPRAPVLDLTDADWAIGMEVYFLNVVRPVRLVAPIRAAQGGGRSSPSRRPGRWSRLKAFPHRRCSGRALRPSPSSLPTSMRQRASA